jgi:hypothetical protein
MTYCKQCGKEIISNTGRRPKEYCDEVCRNAYHNSKPKETTKVWKSTYDAVVLENTALKLLVKELQNGNPVTERMDDKLLFTKKPIKSKEVELLNSNVVYVSPTPESFDGEKNNHYLNDEFGQTGKIEPSVFTPTNQDQINKLKGELALITGKSDVAIDMRRKLQKKIDQLQKVPRGT